LHQTIHNEKMKPFPAFHSLLGDRNLLRLLPVRMQLHQLTQVHF